MEQIACNLSVLTPSEVERHRALRQQLASDVQETQRLKAGYRFRHSTEHLASVAEFIDLERRCCPFLGFRLEVPPGSPHVWLDLTGDSAAVSFLRGVVEGSGETSR